MSVASSFPCTKISPASSSSSSHSSSCSSNHSFMLSSSSIKPYHVKISIRSSQTEGPIRRPAAPSLQEPSQPFSLFKPTPHSHSSHSPSSPSPPPQQLSNPAQVSGVTMVEDKNVVTLEFKRQKAKEIQDKNEISNDRASSLAFSPLLEAVKPLPVVVFSSKRLKFSRADDGHQYTARGGDFVETSAKNAKLESANLGLKSKSASGSLQNISIRSYEISDDRTASIEFLEESLSRLRLQKKSCHGLEQYHAQYTENH
ncbi:hypothetical protein PS2_014068 [Malus domestica]